MRTARIVAVLLAAAFLVLAAAVPAGRPQEGADDPILGLAEGLAPGGPVTRGRPDPFAPLRPEVVARVEVQQEKPREPAPQPVPETDIGGIALRGIMWSPQRPMALINDQFVTVNQSVAGWRVVEIARDRVVLESAGRRETLMIDTPDFLTPAAD